MALTAIEVKNARPGRHADGLGLYLMVRPSGSKSWVFRVQVDGKRMDLGLGSASKVSLALARSLATELRGRIGAGADIRAALAANPTLQPTFEEAAIACHDAIKAGWRNRRHSDSWLRSLEIHIFSHFGSTKVEKVTSAMVRDALAPIWLVIPESAQRILQRIRTVLDYSHIMGWCPHEATLRSVAKGLPRQLVEENHYAAMPYSEVPTFVTVLHAAPESAGRDALIFTILNAVRSGETRHAIWPEFDLDEGLWSIPATRMKMRQPHVVPLSEPSVALLRRRWPLRASDRGLVFSSRGTKPLSDMTMTKVLRDLGIAKATVHGFRSSFTDWAAEQTDYPKEIVDKALAHKLADRVEAAYRRTDFLEKRRALMRTWSHFICAC